jgi:ribosomal protein L37AE/L43A
METGIETEVHVCEPNGKGQFSTNPDDLKCPDCKCSCEVRIVDTEGKTDIYQCDGCDELWYANGTQLQTKEEHYESVCESREAAHFEEAAHGRPDVNDYIDHPSFRDDLWG